MTERVVGPIEREIAALEAEVGQAATPVAREQVKRRIVAIYKETESSLTHFESLRDRIKGLVEAYKQGAAETTRDMRLVENRPVIRADHLGASTFIDKGWSLIALGDHAAAEQALTRALELAPGDLQATSLLGWAQMLGQKFDEALAAFSRVLAAEPTNALARVNVGYICLKKRIFGEAIEHLSRAIRLDNDRKAVLYAHYYLGLVYLEREMDLDAQTFFEKAIQLGPNLIEAYYDLGRAKWFAGDHAGAMAVWHKGANANRFAPWAKRCQELLEAIERGESVPRSSPPVSS
ncbi:MAG: tetratricopeptide repeat protein [Gemmatimonadales bacterium]